MFVNGTANVCERHGKCLWTPRQMFVNGTAKVCERHGKSLRIPRQKWQHLRLAQSSLKSTGKHITFESQDKRPCLDDQILVLFIWNSWWGYWLDNASSRRRASICHGAVSGTSWKKWLPRIFQYVIITSCDLQRLRSWREGLELSNTLLDSAVNGSLMIYSLNTCNCGYLKMERTLLMVKGT